MSRALIQTANPSTQNIAVNSIITPGSVQRRYGCNCRLSGNAIELVGEGYYGIDAGVTVTPTAAGPVTVGLYENGVQIPGAVATAEVATAGNSVTLTLPPATVRLMCCDSAKNITLVLTEGPGTASNAAIRVVKE